MPFLKYPSLENHYNVNPEYLDMDIDVLVMEKIDGSNISIVIEADGSYRFASRNQLVGYDWNDLGELIDPEWIDALPYKGRSVNVYGEVFSSKILKRIPYGDTQVRFFAMAIDGEILSAGTGIRMLKECGFPVVECKFMKLGDALDMDVQTLETAYAKDAIAEGIVIHPCGIPVFNDRVYAIKKKSDKFIEKSKSKKNQNTKELTEQESTFLTYLNENRVISYISKQDEPLDIKRTGVYIREIGEDALQDYLRDLPENERSELDTIKLKKLFGRVSTIVLKKIRSE